MLNAHLASLSADLGTLKMAVAPSIADIADRLDEPKAAGSVDGSFWDVASICQIDAKKS
jgi:hypothetical protein